jgi:recombination protein RecA
VAAVHKNRIAFLFVTDAPSTQLSPQSPTHHPSPITHHSKGGQALRYFASVRLEIERREWIRKGREVVGCRSAVRMVKNKLAAPHREAEVNLWFYRFPQEKPASATRAALKHPR